MLNVFPNNSHQPANPTDNPVVSPLLGIPSGFDLNIGKIAEAANIGNEAMGYIATPQGPHNMLMEMRNKFPFVPILPWPTFRKTVRLVSNTPLDIHFPTGVICIRFKGSASYLMSATGNAQLPVANDGDGTDSVFMPDDIWFYSGNLKNVSVIAPDTGTLVSVQGFHFHELPRY